MSTFPQTRHDMVRAGYKYLNTSNCKGCGRQIEWWKTTNGSKMPFDPIANDDVRTETHWATCPKSKQFKDGATPNSAQPGKPSHEQLVRELRDRTHARVVVLVDDKGTYACWAEGIPAEDLRHDLISASNFVRGEIRKKEGAR